MDRFQSAIRVVYLCEFPTLLGGERSLLTFLSHRRSAAIEPVVVAPATGPLSDALSELEVEHLDWPEGGRHRAEELSAALRDHNVQIVHSNSLMMADAAGALGRILGLPAVAHVRDIMSLSAARRERLGRLAALIAVSDAVATWLRQAVGPSSRVERIYNAVDAHRLREAARPGSLRDELELSADVPLIGCIGQIALRKAQDLFLDSAARLAARFPDARFVLAGARYSKKAESQSFEQRLHAMAQVPPLTGKVHLLGQRDDIPSVLADLDVLTVPSRQEPLSRVLLEGLALGTPAVATDVGGTREILTHRGTGLIVPPDDPDAMAEAVGVLLSDPDLRAKFRRAGPITATKFSPRNQTRAVRRLYEDLLAP